MSPNSHNAPDPSSAATPSDEPAASLAARAQEMRKASMAGLGAARLRGRNVALLCEEPDCAQALLVYRAALGLGAHVSLVRPQLDVQDAANIADTGRMLGRLYDAVVAVGVSPQLVQALRAATEVPVLDESVVGAGEMAMSAGPQGESADSNRRLHLWQAALVGNLA